MALFATRKPGKEGSVVLSVLPWCIATLMLVLWLSSSARPSVSKELQLLRQELADQYAAVQSWSSKHMHHRTPLVHHTAAADTPWQLTATCNSSLEHVQLLEKLLQPKAFLNHLVQQKGKSWLQIGSNTMDNMNNNDPMKKLLNGIPTWKKVFVEPVPQLYAKLEKSIKRWPNATAINVALSPNSSIAESTAQMWCYGAAFDSSRLGKDLPSWANQICSFNASHIGRHFKGQQGVPVDVTALSLAELLKQSAVQDVQVLMIDTEGFDYEVLKQIPFEQMRPAFVLWEHKHLYANRKPAEQLMRSRCYAVRVLDKENTVGMSLF